MSKPKFFADFDNTIVNSTKQYCKVYNTIYKYYPSFVKADYTKIQQYNMKDQCPLVYDLLEIFQHELFFRDLEFINDNTYEVLEKLSKKYQLIVASIGTPINIARKALFLGEKLSFIKDYVLICNDGCKMQKDIVNMSGEGNIFLDDVSSNLYSSNAENKVLFGKRYEWNMDWDKDWVLNWSVIKNRFL